MMLVMALAENHTHVWYPDNSAFWVTFMVPPLLCSRIFAVEFQTRFTKSLLQNRSMVDWLSSKIMFARSKRTLLPFVCRTCSTCSSNCWNINSTTAAVLSVLDTTGMPNCPPCNTPWRRSLPPLVSNWSIWSPVWNICIPSFSESESLACSSM